MADGAPLRRPAVEVVRAAQSGDRAAFEQIYMFYYPLVHSVAFAHAAADDVGDIVHDVFAQALVALHTLREPEAIAGWLRQMALNTAGMRRRKSEREVDLHEGVVASDCAVEESLDAEFALTALRRLPPAYQEALVLRFMHGLTGPEIADRLGMTHSSVRVNLHRGLSLLRARLGVKLV